MITTISYITLLVRDQDEALDFYCRKLGFEKVMDESMGDYRWVVVSPQNQKHFGLTLVKVESFPEAFAVGKQTGGRTLLVLNTDNIEEDIQHMQAAGIKFTSQLHDNPWGRDIEFEDLYGNPLDLVEPKGW